MLSPFYETDPRNLLPIPSFDIWRSALVRAALAFVRCVLPLPGHRNSRLRRRCADHSGRTGPSHPGTLRRHRAGKSSALAKIFRRRLHLRRRERAHHGQGETGGRHHANACGYSGRIKVTNVQSRIIADTAVLSYDLNETEIIFGQKETARYHTTDTWLRRNGEWQIIASQAHRYYEDPAVGKADEKKFPDFIGTYELAPGQIRTVGAEGEKLFVERNGKKEQLFPETSDLFFRKGVEGRILFHYDANGKVDTLIDRRNNEDVIWRKIK